MKLVMPSSNVNIHTHDYNTIVNVNALRNLVQSAATRLKAEIVEIDYDVFVQFSFVGEAYRIALYHAMYADEISDVKNYLERCVEVFQGQREEMAFVDGEFPDYVRAGFDRLLAAANKKLQENGMSGAFDGKHLSLYDNKNLNPILH